MVELVPVERIASKIYLIRGMKVMLDRDLAELYGVETKVLKQSVRRNSNRFPSDFMFELTKEENNSLRSQNVTLKRGQHAKLLALCLYRARRGNVYPVKRTICLTGALRCSKKHTAKNHEGLRHVLHEHPIFRLDVFLVHIQDFGYFS